MRFSDGFSETVRKGSRGAFGALFLGTQSLEIGLLRPVSSGSETSARGCSGLFGQFQKVNSRKPALLTALLFTRTITIRANHEGLPREGMEERWLWINR
jgi:hypothetical protein